MTWTRARRLSWSALALALLVTTLSAGPMRAAPPSDEKIAWRWSGVGRVVAIADVHGAFTQLVALLRSAELLDDTLSWSGGRTHLVSLGDLVDRGPDSRRVLDLLIRLQGEAPASGGQVHVLLGNHEVMNLVGDLRYVSDEEFLAFAEEELPEQRKAAFKRFLRTPEAANLTKDVAYRQFQERYPLGYFGHRAAFSPRGKYGKWLLERPALIVVNRTAFVHGGLPPMVAEMGGEELNRRLVSEVREFLELQERLASLGLLDPETPFSGQPAQVQTRLRTHGSMVAQELEYHRPGEPEAVERNAAERYLDLFNALAFRADAPLWYRGTSRNAESDEAEVLDEALEALDADRVVVGHTPTKSRRVTSRFEGRVIRLDAGTYTPAYKGRPAVLIMEGDKTEVVYPLEDEIASPEVEPPTADLKITKIQDWPDEEVEEFLRTAKIVHVESVGGGITQPRRVTLEKDTVRVRAIFKDVNVEIQDRVRLGDQMESHFTDRYHYEVASYRIDRLLGLGMVPVTVLRTVDGTEGSLQLWVEDGLSGEALEKLGIEKKDPGLFGTQRQSMHVFDVIIFNIDRNDRNELYTLVDRKLHLIDHSRAFRTSRKRPPDEKGEKLVLTPDLAEALRTVELEALQERLHGLLSGTQIKAVKKRMDLVLEEAEIAGGAGNEPAAELPAEATEQSSMPVARTPARAA